MPESMFSAEAAIKKQFECCSRQFAPIDFKVVDVSQEGDALLPSQIAYSDKKGKAINPPLALTNAEPYRELNDDKLCRHRKLMFTQLRLQQKLHQHPPA